MGGMVLALGLRRAERRVLERLFLAGATRPDAATTLPDLGRLERPMLRRLVWGRAVVAVGGAHYIDATGYSAYRRRRWIRAIIAISGVLILAGLAWWRS